MAIFAFDDEQGVSSQNGNTAAPRNNRNPESATLLEKEWPRLGGKASPALKPASGLRGAPQTASTSASAVGSSLASLLDAPTRAGKSTGTAKGGLALLLASSCSSSRAPSDAGDIAAERAAEAASASRGRKKNKKNKNKNKGANNRATGVSTAGLERPDFLLPRTLKASPSTSSLREQFNVTAPTDAEYTWGNIKRSLDSSSPSSVASSPPRSGLSSLLSLAHPGDIVTIGGRGSDTSASSENGGDEPMVAYEVAIDEDYVSKDVDSAFTSRDASPSRKKVTADDFEPLKCLGKGA